MPPSISRSSSDGRWTARRSVPGAGSCTPQLSRHWISPPESASASRRRKSAGSVSRSRRAPVPPGCSRTWRAAASPMCGTRSSAASLRCERSRNRTSISKRYVDSASPRPRQSHSKTRGTAYAQRRPLDCGVSRSRIPSRHARRSTERICGWTRSQTCHWTRSWHDSEPPTDRMTRRTADPRPLWLGSAGWR